MFQYILHLSTLSLPKKIFAFLKRNMLYVTLRGIGRPPPDALRPRGPRRPPAALAVPTAARARRGPGADGARGLRTEGDPSGRSTGALGRSASGRLQAETAAGGGAEAAEALPGDLPKAGAERLSRDFEGEKNRTR